MFPKLSLINSYVISASIVKNPDPTLTTFQPLLSENIAVTPWCGWRELNPHLRIKSPQHYHYVTPAYVPTLRILTKLASIFVDSCLAYNALLLGSGGLVHLLQAFRQSVVPTLIVNGLVFTHRAYNPRKYALTYCASLLDGFLSTRFPLSQLREDFNLNRQAILLFPASSYHLR